MIDFIARFGWPETLRPLRPLAIAHRGASDYAPENTGKAFRMATELGAEMWEIDVRVTADGHAVICHDPTLARVAGDARKIKETPLAQVLDARLPDGQRVPTLAEVIELARTCGAGLYVDLKDADAGPAVWHALRRARFRFAAIGAFEPSWVARLREAGCEFPLAVLVPEGADPLDHAAPARPDIVHPCWRGAGDRPDRLLTDTLVGEIRRRGMEIVTWHEHRADVIAALRAKPILGICSNQPELLKPANGARETAYVCHRGANTFAPENTLAAARICFDQGFDIVEIDVRTTRDGHVVVMHDEDVARTTDGSGPVAEMTFDEVRRLDAGAWFGATYAGTQVPTLDEMLDLAREAGRGIYVEIKDADPAYVLRALETRDLLARSFIWARNIEDMRWLRANSDAVQLMAPRWAFPSLSAAIADYRADIVEYDVTRDPLDELPACREAGVRSMIYTTVEGWADLAHYRTLAPDLVNLDRPDRYKLLSDYPAFVQHARREQEDDEEGVAG